MKLLISGRLPQEWSRDRVQELFQQLERQVNGLAEGAISARHMAMSAAPTSGNWVQGDIVWNSAPTAGGFIGWVCTVSGTPGTWRTWGAIS